MPLRLTTPQELLEDWSKLSVLLMDVGNFIQEEMGPDKFYTNDEICSMVGSGISKKLRSNYGDVQLGSYELTRLTKEFVQYLNLIGILKKHPFPLFSDYFYKGEESRQEIFRRFRYVKDGFLY